MIKSRIPVPSKIRKIPSNNEEIGSKKQNIDSKSSLTVNTVLCRKKIQIKAVDANKVKCQQAVGSKITGERHDQQSSKFGNAAQKVKSVPALKVHYKSLNPKPRCPTVGQKSVLKPHSNVLNLHENKTEQNNKTFNSKVKGQVTGLNAASKPQHAAFKDEDKKKEKGTKDESEENCWPEVCEKENVPEFKCKPPHIAQQNDIKFEANEAFRQLILSGRELTPSMLQRESGFKSSFALNRPSIYKPLIIPADPSKEALKALEKAKLNPRPSQVRKGSIFSTPMKESSYHLGDPYEVALKSLETLRKKKLMKSQKKVTFNFQVSFQSTEGQNKELPAKGASESRLTDISEKDETSQNSSRENSCKISAVAEELGSLSVNPSQPSELSIKNNLMPQDSKSLEAADSANHCVKLPENKWPHYPTSELLEKTRSAIEALKPTSSKCSAKTRIFTPCPVSCKPLSSVESSGSPEFLGEKARKMIAHDVPICTPLVLKRLAKENEVEDETTSPIRLKLDFNDLDLESKKENSPFHMQSQTKKNTYDGILLRDIPTARKMLDHLADEECSVILLKQKLPMACGRSMRNPIALILSEGDETHFIPVGSLQSQQ